MLRLGILAAAALLALTGLSPGADYDPFGADAAERCCYDPFDGKDSRTTQEAKKCCGKGIGLCECGEDCACDSEAHCGCMDDPTGDGLSPVGLRERRAARVTYRWARSSPASYTYSTPTYYTPAYTYSTPAYTYSTPAYGYSTPSYGYSYAAPRYGRGFRSGGASFAGCGPGG